MFRHYCHSYYFVCQLTPTSQSNITCSLSSLEGKACYDRPWDGSWQFASGIQLLQFGLACWPPPAEGFCFKAILTYFKYSILDGRMAELIFIIILVVYC